MDTTPRFHRHALLAALLACALASAGSAQPVDYATDQEMRVSTTMIALLAAVIAVFVLIAASIIYLRHCTGYDAYAARPPPPSDRFVPAADLSAFLSRRLQRRTRGTAPPRRRQRATAPGNAHLARGSSSRQIRRDPRRPRRSRLPTPTSSKQHAKPAHELNTVPFSSSQTSRRNNTASEVHFGELASKMDTTPRLHQHALLAALLVCALASAGSAQAQPADYATDQEMRVSTTMIVLLAAVIAVFVLIAASIIYLRHCAGYSSSEAYAARPSDRSVPAADLSAFLSRRLQRRTRGLDAGVVEAFPTMRYAEAKALRVGKKGASLECAVCLSEFDDEERLRLLPRCSHAFHPDCIGEWLASHVTCPVCRCNLDPSKDAGSDDEPSNTPPAPALQPNSNSNSSEIAVVRHPQEDASVRPPSVVIDVVTEEEAEQRRKEAMELQRIGTQRRAMRSRPATATAKLVRSHSTGHSPALVRLDRDLERFTLRLPEHLRREMMAAGEQSSRRGGRLGRSSGKWPSFLRHTRTLSGKFFSGPRRTDSSDGGEVSSTSSTRIRGKRVAAVDFAADGSAVGGAKVVGSVAVDVDKASGRQVRT